MFDALMTDEMKPWRDLLLVHQFAVDEIRTKLTILDEEYRNVHDYNPIEHIKYRVKKPAGIMEKLQRIGLEPTVENARSHIFDIAGIRIVCAFTADIYCILELLSRQKDFVIVEVKDYIKNPKENGYKSLHVHIEYPVFLSSGVKPTRVEIQFRTIAMDFWASVEHKIYYKYREHAPRLIQAELKGCAEMISSLDDRMYRLKQIIDELESSGAEAASNSAFYREPNDDYDEED